MRALLKYFAFILFVINIISCIENAENVDAPEFIQKFVIESAISPSDSLINIYVDYNSTVYGYPHKDSINKYGVELFISDGINEERCTQNRNYFTVDTSKMKIKEGRKYSIRISDNKGNKADAECTIPIKRDLSVKWDTATKIRYNDYGSDIYFLTTLKITDYPGEQNYYAFKANFEYYNSKSKSGYESNIPNPVISDVNNDGKELQFDITDYNRFYLVSADSAFLEIEVAQIDKNYYDFVKSVENYNNPGDSPFTELSPLYSNINGGLGVFCGYMKNNYTIRLK